MGIILKNINRIGQGGRVGFRTVVDTTPVVAGPLTWTTPPGTLGTYDEGSAVSIQIAVTDTNDNIANWSITAGSLPVGLDLNPFSGTILGTPDPVTSDETATFSLRVADADGNVLSGNFSITIRDVPTIEWVTPAGQIAEVGDWAEFEVQLEARPV